ncbi:MAG: prepilin-type N-terminal cleavage/methylation domain-containing protein [Planctomycetota bacterium]
MNRKAFTLIELLVVIAIIALLIGILLPALGQARCSARKLVGATNHRALGQGFYLYAEQFDDFTPFGHTTDSAQWAYTWPAQLRFAMGGVDGGSMESFLNPNAPAKIFNIEWESIINPDGFRRSVAKSGENENNYTRYGYEENEMIIKQGPIAHQTSGDIERFGWNFFSIGLNETGTHGVSLPTIDGKIRCLGVGQHASFNIDNINISSEAARATILERRANIGPKLSGIADPANFFVFGDSLVDGNSDPVTVSGTTRQFTELIPAAYGCGEKANMTFADGHVESVTVRDIVDTDETLANQDQPQVQASMRRWNNDGDPHNELWTGLVPAEALDADTWNGGGDGT